MSSKYFFSFEKLVVWQKAINFVKYIYLLTRQFPDSEKYNLTGQLKRAAVSIPSNISEGTSRDTLPDKRRFLSIAYGSLLEVYNHLIISKELNFITQEELEKAKADVEEISRMLNSLKKNIK